jgi:hypothetical protein
MGKPNNDYRTKKSARAKKPNKSHGKGYQPIHIRKSEREKKRTAKEEAERKEASRELSQDEFTTKHGKLMSDRDWFKKNSMKFVAKAAALDDGPRRVTLIDQKGKLRDKLYRKIDMWKHDIARCPWAKALVKVNYGEDNTVFYDNLIRHMNALF